MPGNPEPPVMICVGQLLKVHVIIDYLYKSMIVTRYDAVVSPTYVHTRGWATDHASTVRLKLGHPLLGCTLARDGSTIQCMVKLQDFIMHALLLRIACKQNILYFTH